MSKHSDSEDDDINKNYTEVFESSQICFRFAEEIRMLRLELLALKQEKRSWLSSNNDSSDALLLKDEYIKQLKLEIVQLNEVICADRKCLIEKDEAIKLLNENISKFDVSTHKLQLESSILQENLRKESKLMKTTLSQLQESKNEENRLRTENSTLKNELKSVQQELKDCSSSMEIMSSKYKVLFSEHSVKDVSADKVIEKTNSIFQLMLSVGSTSENAELEEWLVTHGIRIDFIESYEKIAVVLHAIRMMIKRLLTKHTRLKGYVKKLMEVVQQYDSMSLPTLEQFDAGMLTHDL